MSHVLSIVASCFAVLFLCALSLCCCYLRCKAKQLVKFYWNQNRTDEGWNRELEGIKEITRTRDCQEGIRAFLEKRDPDFRGPYYENSPFPDGNGD